MAAARGFLKRGTTVDAVDLFCGFGGSSQGIHAAGASVRLAANHSPLAIDCHAANYPDTEHSRADLSDPDSADYVDPLNPDYELRRAMAFGLGYVLLGNKTQMTYGLGNAVTPPVASWITGRCLDTLKGLPAAA